MPDGTDFLRGADRRVTPARGDLAASSLKGLVDSDKFVEASPNQVKSAIIPMRPAPDASAEVDTMLLYGEIFNVYDTSGGWAWGQAVRDGYVGYVPHAALSDIIGEPTHKIAVPTTHLYPVASIKSEPVGALWMSSQVRPDTVEESNAEGVSFARMDGLFLPAKHLVPIGETEDDYVTVAEKFLHAPYVWGGKTAGGVDCSGLVQVALAQTGIDVPRDSDMQAASIGTKSDPAGPLKRGDLLFWPGHVGIMKSKTTLLHATAHSMRVVSEPVKTVRKRIEKTLGLPLKCVRRP